MFLLHSSLDLQPTGGGDESYLEVAFCKRVLYNPQSAFALDIISNLKSLFGKYGSTFLNEYAHSTVYSFLQFNNHKSNKTLKYWVKE